MEIKNIDFSSRHIGVNTNDKLSMLEIIGYKESEGFLEDVFTKKIKKHKNFHLPDPLTEGDALEYLAHLEEQNIKCQNYIGMGYYPCFIPPVIRKIFLKTQVGTHNILLINLRYLKVG